MQCEIPIERCPPEGNPCANGGTCINRRSGFSCGCLSGFSGDTCETELNECDPNPCERGACQDLVGGFACDCPDGFTGNRCQIEIASANCTTENPCENGGLCIDEAGSITCDCTAVDFSGAFCSTRIDNCADANCQNGSACLDGVNDYTCENCPLGFAGKDCDEAALCDDDPDNGFECAPEQFCDNGLCAPDVCDPDEARSCSGQTVQDCRADGSGRETLFTCGSRIAQSGEVAYSSTCQDPAQNPALEPGDAYCNCQDDWDCPAHTVCEVNRCVGTGKPATCRLPAEPFTNVLPSQEIEWGSPAGGYNDNTKRFAPEGTPFPTFTQVVMTPTVANLDDDNGDGLIDERDFPEIIFLAFCWPPDAARSTPDYKFDGILRVIHGGGTDAFGNSKKGDDYISVCGDSVWRASGESVPVDTECVCTLDPANNKGVNDSGAGLNVPRLNPTMIPAVAQLNDDNGDGLIDERDFPEIVVMNENRQLEIYDNTGGLIATSRAQNNVSNAAITIANIDNDGMPELVVGRNVNFIAMDGEDLVFTDYFRGDGRRGGLSQGPAACVADILGDDRMEIIGGSTVYRVPLPPAGISMQSDIVGNCDQYASGTDAREFCEEDLRIVWNGNEEGFCAVADVWGPDANAPPGPGNAPDGQPEVILIGAGQPDSDNGGGWLTVFRGTDGHVIHEVDYDAAPYNFGGRGGAPNVDDFDGDGYPEVGTAFSTGYALIDLQATSAECPAWTTRLDSDPAILAPGAGNAARQAVGTCDRDADCTVAGTACNEATGQCICLHNGWLRKTEDDSSRLTGSSVFDFNGDGAAEVVYNDECEFRVYDGLSGNVLFNEFSESRTRIEYPLVADVDNDGNAEIVFGTSNESGFCGPGQDAAYNAGIEVWGDAGDFWVSARRMWNQHAYHVTNVTENALVPLYEPKGWRPAEETNGRDYNTYRSNPRNFGVAPDLEVSRVQVVSALGGCGRGGSTGQLVAQISNIGDLRVGPGVVVAFEGRFDSEYVLLLTPSGAPLISTVENTLEPRDSVFLSVDYDAASNGEAALPADVRVTVDVNYDAETKTLAFDDGAERECREDNNTREISVDTNTARADLLVQSVEVATCTTTPNIDVLVDNPGSADASGVLVRIYAGNPNQGGSVIGEETIPAPVLAGSSSTRVSFTPRTFPFCTSVRVFAVVDPLNSVEECNDGNNLGAQSGETFCCIGQGG